jgi:hypothetical protein
MTELASSFQDYEKCIMKGLKSLTFNQVLMFCVWCASRLLLGDKYAKQISQDEVSLLHSIIEEAWSWTEKQKYPDVEYVKEIRNKISKIGSEDPVAAIEVHPLVTDIIGTVDLVFEYYMTKSIKYALSAANSMINVIDYEADEAGNRLQLETMLLFPAMGPVRNLVSDSRNG